MIILPKTLIAHSSLQTPPGRMRTREREGRLLSNQKKCYKCHGYGHFQADYPNKKLLTIEKIEGMSQMVVEIVNESQRTERHLISLLRKERCS